MPALWFRGLFFVVIFTKRNEMKKVTTTVVKNVCIVSRQIRSYIKIMYVLFPVRKEDLIISTAAVIISPPPLAPKTNNNNHNHHDHVGHRYTMTCDAE